MYSALPSGNPRLLVTSKLKRKLYRELNKTDPDFVERMRPFLRGLYDHYFRCEMTGWENAPEGAAVFVGNHNGLLTFEVLMLFYAWVNNYGWGRRVLGLAHSIALKNRVFSWLIPRLGAIPANPQLAVTALKEGYSLMVFPGGEKEAFRPYRERKKLDFYQRKGFIRVALEAGVPLVPIVSIGAHETYVILDRGEKLAEVLGIKEKLRLHGLPITFRSIFFMWCLVTGIFTFFPLLLLPGAFAAIFVPLPAKMTFRMLEPIDPRRLWDLHLSEEENLQKIYDHVTGIMQKTLTDEYAQRRLPVVG